MITKMLSMTFLMALTLVNVFAQQKPDFSGTWKLNVAKSEYGVLPGPTSRTDVITHKEPSITNQVTADGAQGKQDYTVNYSTDAKEVTNKIGEIEVKSIAKWEGNNLIVNSKLQIQDTDVSVIATWVLSADRKTLTISAHISSAMGETDQKLTFEKQAGEAAAPATQP